MEFDIRKDTQIDSLKLDVEWVRQPALYFHYSEALAQAKSRMDRAKDNQEFVKADLDGIIREDMAARGVKVTEASVQSGIATHPDMRAAQEELSTARDEVNMLQAAVAALEHKKYALQNLVQLHGMNYFSSLTVKGEGAAEAAQHLQQGPASRGEKRVMERGVKPRGSN